jgi:hypothetical protein
MASPAKVVAVPPTPTEVEVLAEQYQDVETQIAEIKKKAIEDLAPLVTQQETLWDQLVEKVKKFGSQHAEKSKLLYGIRLEVLGTFASSSSIDAAAVETFRLALVKAKQSRVLKRIFEKTVRFTMLPQAATFLRAEHDAGKFPANLFVLFARCTVPKDLSPKLVVRPRA